MKPALLLANGDDRIGRRIRRCVCTPAVGAVLRRVGTFLGLVVVTLSFCAGSTAGALAADRTVGAEILHDVVVTRDAGLWPKVAVLPNGEIVASGYNQARHGGVPGDVALWASGDGGKTWRLRSLITRHLPDTAWYNHAMGVSAKGDLLVVSSGRPLKPRSGAEGQARRVHGEGFFRPAVFVSSDAGHRWEEVGTLPDSPEGRRLVPYGTIVRADDRFLAMAAYTFDPLASPRVDASYFLESADAGRTWSIKSTIGRPEANETDIEYLGNGRWLAAARNLGGLRQAGGDRIPHSIDVYVSKDDGLTWLPQGRVSKDGQHPGHVLHLRDGRVLLTFGDRRAGDFGVGATISDDGGRSWGEAFSLKRGFSGRDSGYPSSVQLEDGTVVTVYYAGGAPAYEGFHMGAVRWIPE